MSIVLGVDLATSEVRVQAIDVATGAALAERRAPLPVVQRGATRTQRPAHGALALELVAAVAGALGDRSREIGALSITGTSGTVVPVDALGAPVGNAVLYDDPRGVDELRMLAAAGLDGRPSGALARAAWMHGAAGHAHPDAGAPSAARFVFTPDVVAAALAARLLPSDTSHALKSGIDPVAATWNDEALAVLGLPRETLPELVAPGRVVGEVSAGVAARIGLPTGVLIVSGMTDGSTGQIATGAVALGDSVGVLGTTLVLKAVSAHDVVDGGAGVYSHVSPEGLFWPGGASNTGAGVLATGVTAGIDPAAVTEAIAAVGPSSAVAYPLARPGERFPVADADFAGFAVPFGTGAAGPSGAGGSSGAGAAGLPAAVDDPAVRFRTVFEGVAFVERLGLSRLAELGVASHRHHLAGGAAASELWNRLRASVLDRPVVVTEQAGSARGAAALAAAALTGESLAVVAERFATGRHVVDPDPALREPLEERYRMFVTTLAGCTQGGRRHTVTES
ncbi:FGGY family carbohydrate kinase [Herbiconiux sp. CPCC 205716]|uniref:FGGY family carbohydrate kinase n=1 Tax=Herbiconiux gentiana TaxID=2970912 RepID=A0ABT2GIL5_9MICO|nr:FGGY family carbohydrate kinase [Herbiconiux gentiana]MCS5716073.1 FGGY family carbohydrate kinase [Herbiconiux gentiana]